MFTEQNAESAKSVADPAQPIPLLERAETVATTTVSAIHTTGVRGMPHPGGGLPPAVVALGDVRTNDSRRTTMYRTTTCTMAAIAVLAATAAPALGQACLGIPAGNGQFALGPTASFMEGAKSYGADFQANLDGAVSIGAGYALTDVDEVDTNGNTLTGAASYELAAGSLSVCPTVGVEYMWFSEGDGSVSNTTFPVGIGIGKSFSAGESLSITPYAMPQYLHMRATAEFGGVSATESANEFGGTLGLQLGTDRIYGGGGLSMTTIDESEPVYFVGLGFVIR